MRINSKIDSPDRPPNRATITFLATQWQLIASTTLGYGHKEPKVLGGPPLSWWQIMARLTPLFPCLFFLSLLFWSRLVSFVQFQDQAIGRWILIWIHQSNELCSAVTWEVFIPFSVTSQLRDKKRWINVQRSLNH